MFLLVVVALLLGGRFWWRSRHWENTTTPKLMSTFTHQCTGKWAGWKKVNFDDGQWYVGASRQIDRRTTDSIGSRQADYQTALAQAKAAQYGVPVQRVGSVSDIRSATADMSSATAGVAAAQKQGDAAQHNSWRRSERRQVE